MRLVKGSGRKPITEGVEKYFTPKADTDYDLVDLVTKCFETLNMKEGIEHFNSDPSIIAIKDKSSDVQRCIINRYLRLLLFRFVAKTNRSVLPVLSELFNDGAIELWLTRFYRVTCVFFNKHKIYNVISK